MVIKANLHYGRKMIQQLGYGAEFLDSIPFFKNLIRPLTK